MLNRLKLHHNKKYQPLPRIGHQTASIGDRIYLWGGWHKHIPKVHTNSDKIKALSVIEVHNLRTGEWGQLPTNGIPPLGVSYHSCTNVGDDLYYFGGRCGHSGCHHDSLYQLNTLTMKWKNVTPLSSSDGPMKKAQCGMVQFHWRNEDYLFIFGGYGVLPVTNHQPRYTYIAKRGKPEYGWTNECHIFSIQSGSWIIPEVNGDLPPPCSNFSMISISETQAIMFGGFQSDGVRMNDVYIVEFGKESVYWTKISQPDDTSISWPTGLCDHAMTFSCGIFGPSPSSYVLIVGGENNEGNILSDCWIFDILNTSWSKIQLPLSVAGRLYHTISSFTLGPHCIWLILFGGLCQLEDLKDWQDQQMMSDTAIVELVKHDSSWVANVVLDNSLSLSSEEYSRKLLDRIFQGRKDWIQVTTKVLPVIPPDEGRARATRAEARADAAEQEAVEARKLAEYTQQLVLQAKENIVKERKESISLVGDLSDTKKRAQLAEVQLKQAQDELQQAKTEAKEDAERISEMKKKLEEVQEKGQTLYDEDRRSDYWILKEEDVVVKEMKLMSKTGNIFGGFHLGTKVMIKRFNGVSSLEEFRSAMDIISSLHHPNLVLVIGATVCDNPVIVMESAPFKPLNIYLEEAPLAQSQLLSLANDVCCGLVYLHSLSVAHGSISGHTVYLVLGESTLYGKLADTCIVPVVGARPVATHVAPEIDNINSYSTESDVYSFGVLLIEMYCGKVLEKDDQLHHIDWLDIATLISSCLQTNPQDRPLVNDVLKLIQQLN